jgi:hypothetical protein
MSISDLDKAAIRSRTLHFLSYPQRDLLVRVTSPARLLGINWDHPDGRQVEHARQAALLREPMW